MDLDFLGEESTGDDESNDSGFGDGALLKNDEVELVLTFREWVVFISGDPKDVNELELPVLE